MGPGSTAGLALILALAAAPALAQTTGPATAAAPRFLPGLTHPDITACKVVSATRRECAVPAGVGGRYLIEALGYGSSTAPDATLAMNIIVGEQVCILQTGGKFTGRGYMHLICETTLATDAPITIAVNMAARGATLDATGPQLAIRALPWDGVVSVRGSDGGPLPAPTPPAGKTPAQVAKPGH